MTQTVDPFVAGASRLIGGLRGRYATGPTSRWWTPVRIVLILTVLTSLAGFMQKAPCRTAAWSNDYQYTHDCYTDVFALYYAEHLGGDPAKGTRIGVPYRDYPVEYPAVIGGLMWTAAEVTNALHPNDPHLAGGQVTSDGRGQTFFDVTVFGLALCALLITWAVARLAGVQRVWDAAMVALAPVVVFDGFINWDLAAVALTCLAMYAWARRRPMVAGVLIGCAVATKLYPVLLLVALLPLCLRARRMTAFAWASGGAVLGWVVAYVPAWLVSRPFPFPDATCPTRHPVSGWSFFYRLSETRGDDWGSPWLLLRYLNGRPLDTNVQCGQSPALLNALVTVALLVVVGAVLALVVFARRRARFPQVVFLLIAGFILVNKVDSPQYCLWLLPFAVLSLPRWGPILVWQFTEVLLSVANFYAIVNVDNSATGIPDWVYAIALLIRDAALIWLVVLVVRAVLRPERDVVRRGGVDDPAGGVLDRAPDGWSLGRVLPAVPAPA